MSTRYISKCGLEWDITDGLPEQAMLVAKECVCGCGQATKKQRGRSRESRKAPRAKTQSK